MPEGCDEVPVEVDRLVEGEEDRVPGGNCIKIGLPGKLILRDYFQENRTGLEYKNRS